MPSIVFDSENVNPTEIRYDVPMPGSHTGRRIVHLDLGLADEDFTDAAKTSGESYATAAGLSIDNSGKVTVDQQSTVQFFRRSAAASGFRTRAVDAVTKPAFMSEASGRGAGATRSESSAARSE